MKRFQYLINFFICITLLTSCLQKSEDDIQKEEKPVPVRVMEIKNHSFPLVVESVGRLAPNMEVTISAEVIGVVESYNADIGDRVKSGQTLVIIDQTDYGLALKEAEANLEVGQARLDAMKKSFVPASEIKRLRYSRLRNRLIIQAGRRRIKIRNVIEVRKTPTKVPLLKWLATPAPGRSDKRKAVEALKNAIEGIATK